MRVDDLSTSFLSQSATYAKITWITVWQIVAKMLKSLIQRVILSGIKIHKQKAAVMTGRLMVFDTKTQSIAAATDKTVTNIENYLNSTGQIWNLLASKPCSPKTIASWKSKELINVKLKDSIGTQTACVHLHFEIMGACPIFVPVHEQYIISELRNNDEMQVWVIARTVGALIHLSQQLCRLGSQPTLSQYCTNVQSGLSARQQKSNELPPLQLFKCFVITSKYVLQRLPGLSKTWN